MKFHPDGQIRHLDDIDDRILRRLSGVKVRRPKRPIDNSPAMACPGRIEYITVDCLWFEDFETSRKPKLFRPAVALSHRASTMLISARRSATTSD